MALNALEKLQNQFVRKTIEISGHKLIITGKAGTLAYLNLTPDDDHKDSSLAAVDRIVTRKAHKRARWYGDTGGINVKSSTSNSVHYKLAEGGALPGKPIQFVAVSDTGGDAQNRKVTGTIELQGPFGWFIAYMEEHRPSKSVRFKGPRGKYIEAPTLSQHDFDAL